MTKYLIEFEKFRPEDDQDLFKAVDAFTRENFAVVEFLKPGRDKKGDFLQAQNYVGIIQIKSGGSPLRYFLKSMIMIMATTRKR